MPGNLANKIALVTGAGRGVGRGIALELAREGADLVVSDLDGTAAEQTAALIRAEGAAAEAMRCDVCDPAQLSAKIDLALSRFGGVDILVNNAHFIANGRLEEVCDDEFDRSILSGPFATFRLMKLARPHMAARGGGVIVNLVSGAMVRWDMSGYGVYGASKSAIATLTRAAACEWGPEGIRVFSIAPFAMSEAMHQWLDEDPDGQALKATIPLRRGGDCEADIGRTVALLAGPGAPYLTGAVIPLDGGLSSFT